MKQKMENYTVEDLQVWKTLFDRQVNNLRDKSAGEYLDALYDMRSCLNPNEIPDFRKLNAWLKEKTGWQIEVVKGLIPVDEFFSLLAEKKFCSSTWLRNAKQLDYLEEPDMFHDIFGHVPLLSNEIFSEYLHRFGAIGYQNRANKEIELQLQRLYWFTIEFGLINKTHQENQHKVYGAGIISSFGETNKIFEEPCKFTPFQIEDVLQKEFRTDIMQSEYVVVESFEQLFDSLGDAEKIYFQSKRKFYV
jgi:phenylalanine-4-hydroxylase